MIEVIQKYYIEEQYKEFAGIINATSPKTLCIYVFHYFYLQIMNNLFIHLLSTLLINLEKIKIHETIQVVLTLLFCSYFAVTLIAVALLLTKEAKPLGLTFQRSPPHMY